MLQEFSNGTLVIKDGTITGKILVLAILGLFFIYFFIRKKICDKKIQKIITINKAAKEKYQIQQHEYIEDKERRAFHEQMRRLTH